MKFALYMGAIELAVSLQDGKVIDCVTNTKRISILANFKRTNIRIWYRTCLKTPILID